MKIDEHDSWVEGYRCGVHSQRFGYWAGFLIGMVLGALQVGVLWWIL